ncbi:MULTISPECIES: alpha-amylase [Marinobacter]|uniref:alpha-amylase n=1 Tax=Marinobacter TaxID=2742 RepID=UPI001248FD6D|nr:MULTISPECIES: alpha-amylase [Marinobacter]MBL3556544.1 alpha-amylase [Marinobacter sp. JB05H06]
MNPSAKNFRLTASLVTCLSLAGCANSQFETAAPPSDNTAASPSGGLCVATDAEMTVSVGNTFAEGEWLRDFYSGEKARVENGEVTMTPAPEAEGLLLLEAAGAPQQSFNWAGATVYFTVTDRFANGRTDNDRNYGRQPDGKDEIGTFHGGDFAGLTDKLDYLKELGVNAVWMTPPFEQIHGWVGGGDRGDFRHYGYHGYYALDFTRPDANFGTREEFRTLVEEAHARGIRVVMDVVMNHPGYATLQDMQTFDFGGLHDGFEKHLPGQWGEWQPESWEDLHAYHALIDYDHPDWTNWWGKDWVRAGIGDYDSAPQASIDPARGSLAFLPDFKTESDKAVDLPVFLRNKENTRAEQLDDATVREYLITWLTDWVREFGVDGFRVDTAKHVEPEAWQELKAQAQKALETYRSNNPRQPLPAEDFWMVAEVFPHTVTRSRYFDAGFDAVINFDLQEEARAGAACLSEMEPIYSDYAEKMNGDIPFNVMSYISSHDTQLFSRIADNDPAMQKRAASALLFTPGTSQIFYGDESGRQFGPTGSDGHQGTRSDMNWADIESGTAAPVLAHWQKLGQFRERHPAIGAGEHQRISIEPYVFSRTHGDDRVIIAFGKE